jgi:hypothetical protein
MPEFLVFMGKIGQKRVDERQGSHGSIDLANTALHHHHIMLAHLAAVKLKATHAAFFTVVQQRQEQIQFLAHRHYYSNLHIP